MIKRQVATGLIIVAVVAAAILLVKVLGRKGGEEEEAIVPDVGVHVGKIVRATLRGYITAYGTVEPEPPGAGRAAAGALISAPVGGILAEIACAEGRAVARGALLFRLDTRLAEVAAAKAAKAVEAAELTYERQKKLLAADGTSSKSFQEAEAALNAARGDLAAARTELALREIRAPLSGTVVRIDARVGQSVETNAVLAEVIALDRLVVTARVPSRDAARLRTGSAVVWGEGGAAPGRVLVVGRDIDPKTDTVLVRASVPSGAGLSPGQFLSLRIVAEEHANVLAVPEESVVPGSGGGTALMVIEGEKAVPKPVKAGLRDGGLAEVEGDGLSEGLVIVTTDAYNLAGETKIHIIGKP